MVCCHHKIIPFPYPSAWAIAEETLRMVDNVGIPGFRGGNWQIDYPITNWSPVSESELLKSIMSMPSKTSSGLDEFSSVMLKCCHRELVTPLLHIVNLSLVHGKVPKKMKTSKVIPLHKRGSKEVLENYRPISLVSTFSKLIERLIKARIISHLEKNKITLDGQHGFIRGKSTTTALVEFVEYVTDRLEEGASVVSVFLDLSKAFDCLDHNIILLKLSHLGFRGTALKWFTSYLSERDQLVEIRQTTRGRSTSFRSRILPVSRGVPQGSVLGPVLFVLFTADLPVYTEPFSNTLMYADDTVLITSGTDKEQLEVQTFIALNLAVEYCAMNDLVFNESKTKQLALGALKLEVDGLPGLESVDSTRHLGIVIDNRLSWVDHLDVLCSKLSSALFALKRIKHIGTVDLVKTTYLSLFESHLRYGIVVWGAASMTNLERVLLIQKKAIRILASLHWRDSCRTVFRDLQVLTVVNIYLLEVISLVTTRQLPRNKDVHIYRTRNSDDFVLPAHRSKRFEHRPSYAGAKFYNILPPHLKRLPPAAFRENLVKWLRERPFYTVKEYMDWPNSSFEPNTC